MKTSRSSVISSVNGPQYRKGSNFKGSFNSDKMKIAQNNMKDSLNDKMIPGRVVHSNFYNNFKDDFNINDLS